jgi:hypothetical protein
MHSLSVSVATATDFVLHGFGRGSQGLCAPVVESGREDLSNDTGVFLSSVVRECFGAPPR